MRMVPLCAVALLAGCRGPLSTLEPNGPAAAVIALLWWAMLIGAGLITLLVLALVWRGFARRADDGPGEGFWIRGMGLGFTLSILVLVVGAGIRTGERIQPHPDPGVLRVEAIARQWEWRFRQPGPGGALIETLGRLHIPAGRPVDVVIRSEDVIHAFWVPQLAGKMDAVPGRDNLLRIQADRPGVYQGRSAEFSGTGFAGMLFEVLAWEGDTPPPFTDKDAEGARAE
ncbi:cytochrome c oxidase subunit II [Falsigemmobacter faecalis]|uniref:Cytochrome c oxidase subunit II n=1 Tax=Falsigemmobacter faecalis TaxID=2488730 RepID=A0A3P3DEW8_9RHOB|nr:cytochrome c oxidase subunit II [Falsigemmobacter faecalis]